MSHVRKSWCGALVAVSVLPICTLAEEQVDLEREGSRFWQPTFSSEVLWESRYVTEGRDHLEGNGTITSFASVMFDWLSLDFSFREGTELKYSELNVGPAFEYDLYDFTVSAYSYHLGYLRESFDDDEAGIGLEYHGLPWGSTLSLDWYYSVEFAGSFTLAALSHEFSFADRVWLVPSLTLGFNSNYVPNAHDGPNHFALRIDGEVRLSEKVSLTAYMGQNWPVDKEPYHLSPGDYTLHQFFWGGIGLLVQF